MKWTQTFGLLYNHGIESMDSPCYYAGGGHQAGLAAG